jgi:hypothetical protein
MGRPGARIALPTGICRNALHNKCQGDFALQKQPLREIDNTSMA